MSQTVLALIILSISLANGFTLSDRPSKVSVRDEIKAMRFPGTYWCGSGFSAEKLTELGAYGGADRCCRQHDLDCPISLKAFTSDYGLTNWRPYTIMHCSCDDRFRSCLKLNRSPSSDRVGRMFFNMMQTPCFVFKEVEECSQRTWWGTCEKYETKKKAVWRDALTY